MMCDESINIELSKSTVHKLIASNLILKDKLIYVNEQKKELENQIKITDEVIKALNLKFKLNE